MNEKKSLTAALRAGRRLLADGAWGTSLQQMGLRPGDCPETWCVERREDVLHIARAYVEAGADAVETNSFGGTHFKLAHFGRESEVALLNRAAAEIAREAAGPDRWVLGSIGPTGRLLLMGDATEAELEAAFAEQARALLAGGADVICIETMTDAQEAALAVRATRSVGSREVICTFTFDRTVRGDFRTMMGLSPGEAAEAAIAAGADVVGSNCGNGIRAMVEIVSAMRAAAGDTPILVQANAGLPRTVDGKDLYPDDPETMAACVEDLLQAGAVMIGGCCGTGPDHIRAMRRVLDRVAGSQGKGRPVGQGVAERPAPG